MEASGKTLPEAKEIVLDLLGVAEDDAEFVVLSEPKAGLFGRMRGEARVQARVRPVTPPPKRGRRQRPERARDGERSRGGGSGRKGGSSRGDGGGSRRAGERAANGNTKGDEAPVGAGGNGNGTDAHASVESATKASSSGQSRRRRGPRGGGGSNGDQPRQSKQGSGTAPGKSEDKMQESLTLEEQGEAAREFVAGLISEFGLNAEVSAVELDEDTVQVAATGDDLGLLVGPRGATLAAVQDLTRTFVQRQSETRTDRILVDVGGYREKRAVALRRFTGGIVEEVKRSGEERALEPMSPADRKVVHDAVNEIEGVETRSAGDEPSRYVVIQPSS
ncbi:MAG: RNA-binding cell elongation regulator Jag/EloR [Acidimicrobiales bacterium]